MDVTSLVSAWDALVLQLSATFTSPIARTWRQIALDWVLHHKPAVTTGIIRMLGTLVDRTWTVYHKFFCRARWSLDTLCIQLLRHAIEPMLVEAGQVDRRTGRPIADLNIDDTTAARYSRHVAHASYFKDASATGMATKAAVIHSSLRINNIVRQIVGDKRRGHGGGVAVHEQNIGAVFKVTIRPGLIQITLL